MIIYDHGQPALLYLVPGCICSILITAVSKGEFKTLMDFSEDEYITPPEEEEDKKPADPNKIKPE